MFHALLVFGVRLRDGFFELFQVKRANLIRVAFDPDGIALDAGTELERVLHDLPEDAKNGRPTDGRRTGEPEVNAHGSPLDDMATLPG